MLEPPSENPRTSEVLRELLFISHSRDKAILVGAGLAHPPPTGKDLKVVVPEYTGYRGRDHLHDTESERPFAFLSRFKMALFGGLALIVPMLIMKLHTTLLTQLLTTCLFVLFVAVVLAYFLKGAETKDVLGATAAYAAVLVVFVGPTG
jgi:VIT1/CCC1 family predicted Fe2+/Mn2+ transporter